MSDSATERTTGFATNGGDGVQTSGRQDGPDVEGASIGTGETVEPTKRNVLAALHRDGSLSPIELGEALGFTSEAMLRHCTELEKHGSVTRRQPGWVRVTVEVPDWKLGDVRDEARRRGFPVIEDSRPASSQGRPELFDTFALNEPGG